MPKSKGLPLICKMLGFGMKAHVWISKPDASRQEVQAQVPARNLWLARSHHLTSSLFSEGSEMWGVIKSGYGEAIVLDEFSGLDTLN